MTPRWLIVAAAALALVMTPLSVQARPVPDSTLAATEVAARIGASRTMGWTGFVETSGGLQVPDSDSFANLAQLLGEDNDLRVWWRSPSDWRVDRIRSTGETDLFRHGDASIRWVFESETATLSPVSKIRLPDASDLLPPTLARTMLSGAPAAELTRLPTRRVAGVVAVGVRRVPSEGTSTVGRVDVWADPVTGLALRVEIAGIGEQRPVLTTALRDVDLQMPAAGTTQFVPADGVSLNWEDAVDVAAAANASAPYDLPPSLAGLGSRGGDDPGAVGIYGRGTSTLIALPLRGSVAGPLRERLRDSGASTEVSGGTLLAVGPITLLVGPGQGRGGFLLAGTVTGAVLERAAADLGLAQ